MKSKFAISSYELGLLTFYDIERAQSFALNLCAISFLCSLLPLWFKPYYLSQYLAVAWPATSPTSLHRKLSSCTIRTINTKRISSNIPRWHRRSSHIPSPSQSCIPRLQWTILLIEYGTSATLRNFLDLRSNIPSWHGNESKITRAYPRNMTSWTCQSGKYDFFTWNIGNITRLTTFWTWPIGNIPR